MIRDANLATLIHVTAAVALIVLSAAICSRLAVRVGQAAVVGEMVSGILLGPTLFGAVLPGASHYLFSPTTKPILYTMAMIGLSLYMFLVGIEHEPRGGSRRDRALPVLLGMCGLLGPIAAGGLLGARLVADQRPAAVPGPVFALFLGGALAVTAFPMLARMLQERNMIHTRFGQVATTAAAIDDALAWCVLATVAALAQHGTAVGALRTIIPASALAVGACVLLPRAFRAPMERAARQGFLGDGLLVSLLVLVLTVGWVTDSIGIYSVFGGFLCGIALPKVPGFATVMNATLLRVVRCLFLPLFFSFSGLNTDLREIFDVRYAVPVVGLLLLAILSKSAVSHLVLRGGFGWTHGESFAMGALMNARGLMILIFINAGLAMHIIPRPLFSMLVVVAVVTTSLALPLYRLHFTPPVEEAARIETGQPPAPRTGRRPLADTAPTR